MTTIAKYYKMHLAELPNAETRIAQLMHDYAQGGAGLHDVRRCEDNTDRNGNWKKKIKEIKFIIEKGD